MLLRWAGGTLGILLLTALAWSETPPARITPATQRACQKALRWLADRQNANGSWSETRFPQNTAITSFALLAFMAQGHLPGQGEYGPVVAKGARFLATSGRKEDGYLTGPGGGNMYCHGMATLALAELWGMSQDPELRPALEAAVALIVRCQNEEGGWRYGPEPRDADISVTIMQVMALRAAKNSGLHVPDRVLQQAIAYIYRCQDKHSGGFRYQPNHGSPGLARTAAGICVLQLAGNYDDERIPRAVEYLLRDARRRERDREHFWYGLYYAAHALHTRGGPTWDQWYEQTTRMLLNRQAPGGEWPVSDWEFNSPGPVYQTSIAVIILSVPTGYLPIFQR